MVPNNLEVLDKLYEITQNEVNIYSYLNAIKNLELRNDQLITDYNKKVNDKDAENRDKFHFYIEMAKLYSMKEKKLLDSIDCLANELVDCSNIHLENIPKIYEGKHIPVYYKGITENHTQTEITENIYLYASDIYERFSNVTEVKINELISRETKAFYGANAAQIRAHKNSDAERRIRKYLNKYITILKLKHLDRAIKLETNENERKELIEYKYSLIFENKDVCDNLLGSKMDIKAFSMPDDKKMATAYQVPLENYIYLKETQILKKSCIIFPIIV